MVFGVLRNIDKPPQFAAFAHRAMMPPMGVADSRATAWELLAAGSPAQVCARGGG
jgi:hypothetical protein